MKLHGKRILVNKPEVKESAFELSEKDKALLEADMRSKWTALDIFAVGDEVERFAVGDKVYLQMNALNTSEVIDVEGSLKLMVREHDIAITW
jgi:Tfp pilus assembly protein PilZ